VLGIKNCAGCIWGQGGKSGIEVGDWRLEIGDAGEGSSEISDSFPFSLNIHRFVAFIIFFDAA
jgi:hypothetical protein